jgi:ABC-type transporter Mla MlaB component
LKQRVLRITTTEEDSPTLKLEGKIGGPWVDELRRTWIAVGERSGAEAVNVDMRGVSYVDRRGADLLLEMEAEGVSIVNCSHFLRQLVHSDADSKKAARRISKRTKKES